MSNDQRCRKKIIYEVYDSKHSPYTCCELCHQRSNCGNCESPDFLVDFLSTRGEIQLPNNELFDDEVKNKWNARRENQNLNLESEPAVVENDEE